MGDYNTVLMQTGLTWDQYASRSFYGAAEQVEAEIMQGLDKYKLKDMGVSDRLIMSKLSPQNRFRYMAVTMFKEHKKWNQQLIVPESVWKQLDNFASITKCRLYNYKAEVMLIAAAYIDRVINNTYSHDWFREAYDWLQLKVDTTTQFDIFRYSRFLIIHSYIKGMNEVDFLEQAAKFNPNSNRCNPYEELPEPQNLAAYTKTIQVVVKSTIFEKPQPKTTIVRKGQKRAEVEEAKEQVERVVEQVYDLPLYKFDSLQTIHERLCIKLNQNISVLVFEAEVSIDQQQNELVQYETTEIEFQTAERWAYNQYENKKLVFKLLPTVEELEQLFQNEEGYNTAKIMNYIKEQKQQIQAIELESREKVSTGNIQLTELLRRKQLQLEQLKPKQAMYRTKMVLLARWLLKQVDLIRQDVYVNKLKELAERGGDMDNEEEEEAPEDNIYDEGYNEGGDDDFARMIAAEMRAYEVPGIQGDARSPARTPNQLSPTQAQELQNMPQRTTINLTSKLSFMAHPINTFEHFTAVANYLMETFETLMNEEEVKWVTFNVTVLYPILQDNPEMNDFMKVVFEQDEEMIQLINKQKQTTRTLSTYQQLLHQFESNPNPKHRVLDLYQSLYELKGEFSLPKTDVFELFNDLEVNVLVPYARAANFVKAVNSIELPRTSEDDKWNADYELTSKDLMFYVSTVDSPTIIKGKYEDKSEFVKVFIKELPDQPFQTSTQFELTIEITNEETEQAIYQRVIDIIKPKIDYLKVSRKFSKGFTLVSGDYNLNPFFFHEMAQNNAVVHQGITYREVLALYSKLRTLMKFQVVLNPDEVANRINISMNLTKLDVGNFLTTDPVFTHFNMTDGDKAWMIYLTASVDFSMVQSLMMKLQLALNYLQQHAQDWIVNYYCHLSFNSTKFITSNEADYTARINPSNTQSFRDVAREIFVSGYRRICFAKHSLNQVKLLTDQEVQDYYNKEYKKKNYQGVLKSVNANPASYMVFPNPAALPNDTNVNRYLMSCPTSSEYKYIGIKSNNRLSNKDRYPFVPCCYKNAKTTPATEAYNKNEQSFQELAEMKTSVDTTKIYTGKLIMRPDQIGLLPERLETMLLLAEGSNKSLTKQVRYLRLGVADPTEDYNFVFIQAIKRALGLDPTIQEEDLQQLEDQVKMNALGSTGISKHVAKQILQQRGYLDPRFWLPAAREVYKTEIILLSQDKKTNPRGSVVCEYFNRFRVVNLAERQYHRCVILFVHNISEWEDLSTPIVEVVVRVKESQFRDTIKQCFGTYELEDDVQACFLDADGETGKSRLITSLFDLLDSMYPTHKISLNFEGLNILDQADDTYSKTRAVWLDENTPTIHTEPICTLIQTQSSDVAIPYYVAPSIEDADLLLQNVFGVVVGTSRLVEYQEQVIGVYVEVFHDVHETNLRSVEFAKPVGIYVGIVATSYTEEMMPRKFDLTHKSYPQLIQVAGNLLAFNERYKQVSKQAMMLKSYMYYVFSHNYPTALPEDVNKFFETSIDVSEDYDPVPEEEIYRRNLSKNNEWFILRTTRRVSKQVEGKRVSQEKPWIKLKLSKRIPNWMYVLQRLKFSLLLDLKNNPNMIKEYKNNRVVPNFYESSDEFKPGKHYTVYNTPEEYEQALHQLDQTYFVYANLTLQDQAYYVQFTYTTPTDKQRMTRLAVPTDSLAKAIKICQQYHDNGSIHVGKVDENESVPENLVLLDDKLKVQRHTSSVLPPMMIGVLKYELVEEEDEDELQAIVDTTVQVKYFALVEPNL